MFHPFYLLFLLRHLIYSLWLIVLVFSEINFFPSFNNQFLNFSNFCWYLSFMFCVISMMYSNSLWDIFHWFPRYVFLVCLCLAVGIILAPNAFSFLMVTFMGFDLDYFLLPIFIFYFACFKREMQDSIAFLCLLSRLPSLFNLKKHGSLLSEIWFCYSTRLCVDLLFFFSILFLFNFDLFPVVSPQCGALANQFFKNCSLFICTAQGIFRCIIQTVSCHIWGLVSLPGFEPRLPALGAWSLSH